MTENRLGFELNSTLEQDFAKTSSKNPISEAANILHRDLYIDSDTGCYNKNCFKKFKEKKSNSDSNHNNLGFIFVDLNNLKSINDTYGHHAGDILIKGTATFLKENCRKEDIVFRLGGDEFIVVCENQNNNLNFEKSLHNRAEEIRLKDSTIDLSFGVAVFDKFRDKSLNDTEHRADLNMFEYKKEVKSVK